MKSKHASSGFYVESLLMVAVFTAVIMILVSCFSAANQATASAKQLTQSAGLCKNAAEAVSETQDAESILSFLQENGNGIVNDDCVFLYYDEDFMPSADGSFELSITPEVSGSMTYYTITMKDTVSGNALYTLNTAVYSGGAA